MPLNPDSSLALIQRGTGRPVFMCHALSGSAWVALPLMRTVRLRRPVYATQAPDLDGPHDVLGLEEMVARYTSDIRAVQARGPYSIVGYSFGGVLAFEIANRLVREGQEVGHLVMLDRPAPPTRAGRAFISARLRARHALCRLLEIGAIRQVAARRLRWEPLAAATYCLGPGRLTSADLRRMLRVVFPSAAANRSIATASFEQLCDAVAAGLERSLDPLQWQSLIRYAKSADNLARVKGLKVYTKNLWLAATYRPRTVFPGRVVIYGSRSTSVKGWQTFTSRPLELHIVPTPTTPESAGHQSFIERPNAALFGDDLRRVLERE